MALVHRGHEITYGELHSRVSRLACGLRETFRAGDLLALWLPNGPEILCLYLACLKAGVVPMPLHQEMKRPEVDRILRHTKVTTLIRSCVDLSRSEPDRGSVPVPADGLALVLHTSGSNGHPKAVMLSHRSIGHILDYRLAHTELGPESVSVVASCLTQSVGLYQSLALLAAGGTLVLLESYDIDEMVECIHRHRPTHLIMVVEAFDRLLHLPKIKESSFESIRFAAVGADRVTSRVQRRFIALTGRPLRVSYGMTESSWALVNPGDRIEKCLALGKPSPDVEVELRDRDGRPVAIDEVGEIHIRSPRNMLGYLNDEERTREALADGWLASGDLAYRDADGYFWFAGRKKNLIVLASGDNVSPVELEDAILCHPAVSQCAVVAMTAPDGSEVPWAFVRRTDEALSEANLLEFLQARISDYKLPREIRFVTRLPVGLTGKVRSGALRESNPI